MNPNATAKQGTILVVDDSPTNIQFLSDLLRASNYRVAIAKTGEIALKSLQGNLPDLILLDVTMPGIDGFETCRRLKASERTQDIPVIFMTALSDAVDKVKGLKLGAVDYLTKPIQHEEVLARIQVHLQLRYLNQTLERQVAERTADLTQALENLKTAQVQLVQSEKMSSLGQLIAGIAHEINNPMNFIYGNLKPAETDTKNLLKLVDILLEANPHLTPEVQAKIEEIDLEFIREDLPNLLSSMRVGAERIREIVISLRNFSRLDEADIKQVDLHSGIESTLLILQNRLKARRDFPGIQVVKDYGQLPEVECYPGLLNQVFMNILSNAIDALDGAMENSKSARREGADEVPRIRIATELLEGDRVRIKIADNGPGMTERVRAKIFDAFFTTKAIGKGTGLGLSISYQIVADRHGGKLECNSTLGCGAEFAIEIPVQQVASKIAD